MDNSPSLELLTEIVDRISVGVLVVNKDYELVLWNTYMENYSQKKAEDVVGTKLFESFPDLPQAWLEQKIRNVFILKNFSFTSWEHRPYLFKFLHNRPITGGIDYMRQNCTFLPIKGDTGDIEYVCITIFDVTDTSIYENMLKNAVRSLAEASNRDGLTDIYNRRFLEQSMSKEFARIKRYGGTLSFIIIDLDHFKNINDTHGHLAGDEILKMASKRIGEHLRESDILARYGGEEFAVMLPETPLAGAEILANRLCAKLAKDPIQFNNNEITISASFGVAEFQPGLENHEQLISRADSALYLAKENGRNQVSIYDHNNPEALETQNHQTATEKNLEGKNPLEEALAESTLLEDNNSDSTILPTKTNDEEIVTGAETATDLQTDESIDSAQNEEIEAQAVSNDFVENSSSAQVDITSEERCNEIEDKNSDVNTDENTDTILINNPNSETPENNAAIDIAYNMESNAEQTTTEDENTDLSAEEKADQAMINAFDNEQSLTNVENDEPHQTAQEETNRQEAENTSTEVIDLPEEVSEPSVTENQKEDEKIIYVKIGTT